MTLEGLPKLIQFLHFIMRLQYQGRREFLKEVVFLPHVVVFEGVLSGRTIKDGEREGPRLTSFRRVRRRLSVPGLRIRPYFLHIYENLNFEKSKAEG